jgi:hypothetical protein
VCQKSPELKINISFISIGNFVDLNNTNKKVNEGDLPRSLLWPTVVFKGTKISLFQGQKCISIERMFLGDYQNT